MKKFIFYLFMSLVMMATTTVNAQNHVEESKVFDNVYVTLSAGVQTPTTDVSFDAVRPTFGVEIGKRMNTYYTMGLGVNSAVNTRGLKTAFDEVDFMWVHKVNVFNLFNHGYDPDRKFEIEAVGELGLGHDMVVSDWYGKAAAGVETVYNLNHAFSLLAKPQIEWYKINDGLNVNHSNLSIVVGLRYNFPNVGGGRGFKICDRDNLQLRYNDLNAEVNELRQRYNGQKEINNQLNEQLARTLELKNKVDTVYVDNEFVPTVSFAINSDKIHPLFNANLYNIAKHYQGKKIVVEGYADAQTGSKEYNLKLSQRRAEAVRDALVKHGFKEEDIEIRACGSESQIFKDNDLNRAAIIVK